MGKALVTSSDALVTSSFLLLLVRHLLLLAMHLLLGAKGLNIHDIPLEEEHVFLITGSYNMWISRGRIRKSISRGRFGTVKYHLDLILGLH